MAKTSEKVGISREQRDNLTAVVFDANAFGYGRPDLNELTYLAKRLAEVSLETWVPEPVAWEWAQHIAKDWTVVKTNLGTENRRLKKAGLAEFQSPYDSTINVAQEFLKKLNEEPLVKVIPLSNESARLGLHDQIMQLPPGRLKSDVKTGASDSAWLRDVLQATGGDVTKLLFVSEDKDIDDALAYWKKPPPLKRPRRDLFATVLHVELNQAATEAVMRYLLTNLPEQGGGEILEITDTPTLRATVEKVLDEGPTDIHVENASISRIAKLSGVVSVVAETPKKRGEFDQFDSTAPHTASARLMLLADAEAVTRVEGSEERDVITVRDILLRADVSFDLNQGSVTAARQDGEIVTFGHGDAFDDDRDAYFTVLDELNGSIPGLELWEKLADSESFEDRINDHDISADFTQVDAGEWTLAVTIDNETAELSCWYDVGARVWDSPESFDMPGAYPMTFDGSDSHNPMWALSAWVIERLYS